MINGCFVSHLKAFLNAVKMLSLLSFVTNINLPFSRPSFETKSREHMHKWDMVTLFIVILLTNFKKKKKTYVTSFIYTNMSIPNFHF